MDKNAEASAKIDKYISSSGKVNNFGLEELANLMGTLKLGVCEINDLIQKINKADKVRPELEVAGIACTMCLDIIIEVFGKNAEQISSLQKGV